MQNDIEKQKIVREIQTWAEMAEDAKAQAEHALKEINANIAWIKVVIKRKRTSVNKMEMLDATLEEQAIRKVRALCVLMVDWAEKGSPQKNAKNVGTKTVFS